MLQLSTVHTAINQITESCTITLTTDCHREVIRLIFGVSFFSHLEASCPLPFSFLCGQMIIILPLIVTCKKKETDPHARLKRRRQCCFVTPEQNYSLIFVVYEMTSDCMRFWKRQSPCITPDKLIGEWYIEWVSQYRYCTTARKVVRPVRTGTSIYIKFTYT